MIVFFFLLTRILAGFFVAWGAWLAAKNATDPDFQNGWIILIAIALFVIAFGVAYV